MKHTCNRPYVRRGTTEVRMSHSKSHPCEDSWQHDESQLLSGWHDPSPISHDPCTLRMCKIWEMWPLRIWDSAMSACCLDWHIQAFWKDKFYFSAYNIELIGCGSEGWDCSENGIWPNTRAIFTTYNQIRYVDIDLMLTISKMVMAMVGIVTDYNIISQPLEDTEAQNGLQWCYQVTFEAINL